MVSGLNLGLKPEGVAALAGAGVCFSLVECSSVAGVVADWVTPSLNRGLKPVGVAALAATATRSSFLCAGASTTTFSRGAGFAIRKSLRSLLNQYFLVWSKLFSPISA